jgi:hypothetical protein
MRTAFDLLGIVMEQKEDATPEKKIERKVTSEYNEAPK